MATAEAAVPSEVRPLRTASAELAPGPPPATSDAPSAQRPYWPDQLTLLLLVACALVILGMNLYDVITGMFGW